MFDTQMIDPGFRESLEMSPGAELARVLEGVDRRSLSGEDRVVLLQARSRLRAHVDAELMADMVSIIDAETESLDWILSVSEIQDLAAAEIQAALTWTRRAAESQVDLAWTIHNLYPRVWDALSAGRIDLPKARVICDLTIHLDSETRDRVVDIALERAPTQTTGLLAARIRRLAIWVDPDTAKKRYENGLEERMVAREANSDGTANLLAMHLSAPDTAAAMGRVDRLARKLKTAGDQRTIDQIRADVFVDLLLGVEHNNGTDRAIVDINVDLPTLIGLADNPGELPGWGPVISDIARQVVDQQDKAEWRYTITDHNGAVITNGTTRRRPDTAMRRRVQAKAPTCVFPGCRMPATGCDIDHNQDWSQGGPTSDPNLAPLCRRDHLNKHHGWSIHQLQPGTYQLTSPLGLVYTTGPDPPRTPDPGFAPGTASTVAFTPPTSTVSPGSTPRRTDAKPTPSAADVSLPTASPSLRISLPNAAPAPSPSNLSTRR
ncbi:MAG: DUF222 domain-containing protein [Acidimicrobiia bacterium]